MVRVHIFHPAHFASSSWNLGFICGLCNLYVFSLLCYVSFYTGGIVKSVDLAGHLSKNFFFVCQVLFPELGHFLPYGCFVMDQLCSL